MIAAMIVMALLAQSPEQLTALTRMTTDLVPLVEAAVHARDGLVAATLAIPKNDAAIRQRAGELRAAERRLALARADAFAIVQRSPAPLSAQQTANLTAMGGSLLRTTASRGGNPQAADAQQSSLTRMATELAPLADAVAASRTALVAASLALPKNEPIIDAKLTALVAAELALAARRADLFAEIQKGPGALTPPQIAALIPLGGAIRTAGLPFTEPSPIDFDDHDGYVSIFDGVSLNGWDGNRKFWRVEDGAIVGESTPENPSGNSYLAYRNLEARDFTLKFEIKVQGNGGSGIQYRSRTGLPWLAPIPANVTANVGPVNLDWMMTGPQADFWPSTPSYTGQFYSENTPMRILAWRGQVVEGFGAVRKRLMGTIGDREALGKAVRMNDWNQYTIIARGGTFIHIINGQLMAVYVDDDPQSSNNWSGQIGIEIEATTKVSVRNIWIKRLN